MPYKITKNNKKIHPISSHKSYLGTILLKDHLIDNIVTIILLKI